MNIHINFLYSCLFTFLGILNAQGQDTLNTEQIDISDCIPLYFNEGKRVVTSRASLDTLIRNDASKERCLALLQELDMDVHSLLGINLNTGWCRVPKELEFVLIKIETEKKYIFKISYLSPIMTCRALSSYDLWIKTPALTDGYEVEFTLEAKTLLD